MMTGKKSDGSGVADNSLTETNHVCWESERIYSSAEQYFENLISDIDHADKSVDMAVYIFTLDAIGRRVIESLAGAAGRNIDIRLLIDGFGSAQDGEKIASQLSATGVKVRIYHPLPWNWSNYRWSLKLGDGFDKLRYFLASMNRRDHRKFCIIDSSIAWCGSFNINQDHLNQLIPWRDYGVRLTGEPLNNLVDSFDSVWYQRQRRRTTSRFLHLFRSNASYRLRRLSNRLLIDRIRNANQRVWICSAYFAPSGAVIRAIKAARSRDLDVRIIVAGYSDVPLFPLLSATYFTDLLKLGVTIYSYQAGVLHAKAMLVDQHCLIGSTNLNHRSFFHDLELDVVLSSKKSIEQIASLLQQDMNNSLLLSLDNVSKWGRFVLFGWLLRIMRYWM